MKTKVSHGRSDYDGSQLSAGWVARHFGIDAGGAGLAVAFRGACDVAPEHMIDLDDLRAGETIVSRDMLHFIAEHPGRDLGRCVLRQRMLVAITCEALLALGVSNLARRGDDIFIDKPCEVSRKLSVSIATTSASGSELIHLGLNVDPEGAPVPAVGLTELGVDPDGLAEDVLARYSEELRGIAHAETKVRQAR